MLEKIFSLPIDEAIAEAVSRRHLDQMPLVVVDRPEGRAAVSLQGAQLVAWEPRGEAPVLWLSDRSRWARGAAIRGGVPLCWPWFDDSGEPMHGFARTVMWELTECLEADDSVTLTFGLRSTAETLALWPYDFALVTRIKVGQECSVELEVHADHPSVAALHTYLRVGSLAQVTIAGLGDRYTDGLRDHAPGFQDGALTLADGEPVERYYTRSASVSEVHDGKLGRTVEVHHRQHSDTVVWNPGAELIQTMPDLAKDAHREFVCVETARLSRPIAGGERNAPGEAARLAMTLTVRS
ncbi:D-hexose-6-phosphate mutarotase [Streptomyces griseorubiginosus]|uniref:D-hexose-6-phosphate mutarotase n=1 Tax=Streptomyces griseorubiginosus TaxID=67304 RepID=UPI0036EC1337